MAAPFNTLLRPLAISASGTFTHSRWAARQFFQLWRHRKLDVCKGRKHLQLACSKIS